MNDLLSELQRLYFHPYCGDRAVESAKYDDLAAGIELPGVDGMTRVMVIRFSRPADWPRLANVYERMQIDLELPAPAVSVSAKDGFQVWISLAAPAPIEVAAAFLEALRGRYLGDLARGALQLFPGADVPSPATQTLDLVPALDPASGRWSAFIDPGLGSVFVDEPGLDMAPNHDRQAQILGQLQSIQLNDFARVVNELASRSDGASSVGAGAQPPDGPNSTVSGQQFPDPQSYLLAVMNDPAVTTKLRIRAATALLPFFAGRRK